MSNEVVIELTDRKQSAAFVYVSSLNSAISRRTMGSALGIIARKLGAANAYEFHWEKLRYPELAAIQTWLAGTRSPATARRMVSAVRGTIKAAWRLGYIDTDSYLKTVDLPPVHGNSRMGRRATEEELAALFATCRAGAPNRGARDLAILTTMFRLGLRVGEIVAAVRSDYQEGTLLVHGKGKKLREVYLYGGIRSAMEEWLERRGNHAGAMFEVIEWDDSISHRPISSTLSVWEMFDKRTRWAGIRRLSPHDARRTSASNLLNIADAMVVSRILGHASVNMTLRYDLRGNLEQKTACERAAQIEVQQ